MSRTIAEICRNLPVEEDDIAPSLPPAPTSAPGPVPAPSVHLVPPSARTPPTTSDIPPWDPSSATPEQLRQYEILSASKARHEALDKPSPDRANMVAQMLMLVKTGNPAAYADLLEEVRAESTTPMPPLAPITRQMVDDIVCLVKASERVVGVRGPARPGALRDLGRALNELGPTRLVAIREYLQATSR